MQHMDRSLSKLPLLVVSINAFSFDFARRSGTIRRIFQFKKHKANEECYYGDQETISVVTGNTSAFEHYADTYARAPTKA